MLAGSIVAACAASAAATPVAFNFETVAVTGNAVGGYTSLNYVLGAASLDITRTSGTAFDVTGTSGRPGSWGGRSLSPFFNASIADKFNANISTPGTVTSISIEYGDFAPSDGGDVYFEVWSGPNATGVLSYSEVQNWPGSTGFPSFGTFSFAGTGIGSIRFWGEIGASNFPNSLFWDNINIDYTEGAVIPLPSVAGMSLAGLAVIGIRRRRNA